MIVDSKVSNLEEMYGHQHPMEIISALVRESRSGGVALVSAFGTESAVLLHMVAQVDPGLPVLFINTGRLFGETLRYRDQLVSHLGLTNVSTIGPQNEDVKRVDADGMLFSSEPNACCELRKVIPLGQALHGFDAWITGRKRMQGGERGRLDVFEVDGGRLKVNPLAHWGKPQLTRWMTDHDLPPHPLEKDGFLSIGCMPCTDRVAPGQSIRSGRWQGSAKTECGIHQLKRQNQNYEGNQNEQSGRS